MASLTRRCLVVCAVAAWAASLGSALAPLAVAQQGQPAADAAAAATTTAADLGGRLDGALGALSEARIEDAQGAAEEVLAELKDAGPEAAVDPRERRALRARALDLIAQCRFAVGDAKGARERVDQLLASDPGYEASGELVGQQYVDLVEARREATVSTLKLDCRPLACEWVEVDGERRPVGEDAAVALLAGTRDVRAGRRNFEPESFEQVELPAGERTTLEVAMVPVARDLVLSTAPPGVRVLVDGELAGETLAPPSAEPSREAESSLPLTVSSLGPGRHRLKLEAPCRRPVERTVEIVLEARNPEPVDLGTIELEPARGVLELAWNRPSGTLSLDGAPVEPGRHEVCPGTHEVTLRLAQRTAWTKAVAVADQQTVRLEPEPRPTLALRAADREALGDGIDEHWNVILLEGDRASSLTEGLEVWADPDLGAPEAPEPLRSDADDLAALGRRLASEADLLAAWVETREGFRPSRRLVLVDLGRSLVEVVAWTGEPAHSRRAARELLRPPRLGMTSFAGFDAAERADGRVIVASVHPQGPAHAAGLTAGAVLAAVDGEELAGLADLEGQRRAWSPGQEVTLGVVDGDGERTVGLEVDGTIGVPRPGGMEQQAVLGRLAHASVAMNLGEGITRAAGTLYSGLALAALDKVQEAATALDRASLDETTDPAQDARATGWTVLEDQLRKLAEGTYADEVAARRAELGAARFGGRDGPPLRWAAAADAE